GFLSYEHTGAPADAVCARRLDTPGTVAVAVHFPQCPGNGVAWTQNARLGGPVRRRDGEGPSRTREGPSELPVTRRCRLSEVSVQRLAHGPQRGQRLRMAGDGEAAGGVAVVIPVQRRLDPRVGVHVGLHRIDVVRLPGRQ